jgi:DNA polymerase III sliding clamp (beta) subunit (PCNA family)
MEVDMRVNRGTLVQVLEFVSPGLSNREAIEHSNAFCFQEGKVITFDDETAASMDSPLKITGAVPAEPFRDILMKLKEENLDIIQNKSKLLIRGKGQSVGISIDKKIELPLENLETPKKWKSLPAEKFSEAIKLVKECASKDETTFAYTCIHLHPQWIEAFDTYQLARFKIDIGLKKSILVRQVALKNIVDLEMNEFSETSHWIHFRNSNGLVISCRRYTDKYPTLNKIIGVSGEKIQLPKSLVDIANRAEVFSMYNTQENYVHVSLKNNWVHVRGEGSYGWYKGRRKISYIGNPMDFMIHPQMLVYLVSHHKEYEVCSRKIKALKATMGDFTFVASLVEAQKPEENSKPKSRKKVKV